MSDKPFVLKALNLFQSIYCASNFIALISLIFSNLGAYTPPDFCPSGWHNIFVIIIGVAIISLLGALLQILCCGLGTILYYPVHFLNMALLGFNIYSLYQINSSCKDYYNHNYDDLWNTYRYTIIFQFEIAVVAVINLIHSVYKCC